jgi:hypothetical protein
VTSDKPTIRQRRRELIAELEELTAAGGRENLIQRCPYTAYTVLLEYSGTEYVGVGFSKVNWPDEWDEDEGYNLAKYRALKDIANQIMRAED